jgi:putative MATE family efflux protein
MSDLQEAMGREPIGRLLWKFSIPSIVGMLANGVYNVVDRIFVARGVGPDALAGVAVVFPLILLVQALSMLVGHGAASIISLRLGEGDRPRAEGVLGAGITLSVMVGLLVVAGTAAFMQPLLLAFGGSPVTLPYAVRFTQVLLPGLFFQVIAFVLNNMIRGQGQPVTALVTMLVSAGVNCVLNPLFIFGLGMGVAGSALATDLAQVVVVGWLLLVYTRRGARLRLRAAALRPRGADVLDVLGVGAAPAFMQIATGAALIVGNNVVMARAGDAGIAVLGVATSLMTILLMPIIGMRAGVQPIIGYNYGARRYDRVRATVRISLLSVVGFCAVAYGLFFAFTRPVIELFAKGAPEILALGVPSVRILLCSIPVVGIAIIGSVYFQSVKKGLPALVINLVRQLLALIPLYVLLPRWFGLWGFWAAGPVADALAVGLTIALLAPEMRRLRDASAEAAMRGGPAARSPGARAVA